MNVDDGARGGVYGDGDGVSLVLSYLKKKRGGGGVIYAL